MRVDIYKRPEHAGRFTYLAVPEGKMIPDEATNTDWEETARGVPLNEEENALPQFSIDEPLKQISTKGYAITSVKVLADENPMM